MADLGPGTEADALQRDIEDHRRDLVESVGELQEAVRSNLNPKVLGKRLVTRGRDQARRLARRVRARPGRAAVTAVALLTAFGLLAAVMRRRKAEQRRIRFRPGRLIWEPPRIER